MSVPPSPHPATQRSPFFGNGLRPPPVRPFPCPGTAEPPGQHPGTESAGPCDGRHRGGGRPSTPPGAGPPGPGAYTPHGGYVPRGRPFLRGGYIRTRVLRHLRAARPEPRSGEVGSAAGADGPAGHTPGTCPDMGCVCGRAPVKIVPGQDGTCPTAYGRKRSHGKHQGSGPRSGRGTAEHAGSGLPAAAAGPALGGHVRFQCQDPADP